jgi:hypothetical protein
MISEEENDKRLKDILRAMDEYFEKNKKPSLYELILEYHYTHDVFQSGPDIANEITRIVMDWMPKEDPKSPPYDGWTKCVKTMKNNLFPKKDT